MKSQLFLTILLFIFNNISFSQKITISGYVSALETGEKLIQAKVYDQNNKKGTLTNDYGFFSITLPSTEVELLVSYIGYSPVKLALNASKDTTINFSLKNFYELQEVTIVANENNRVEETTQMSTIAIPIEQIKRLPALLGEVDVMKTVQMLPGVQSGTEGTTGIYVRGGGPDQNLILLDGVPLYNVSHLGGLFSVFNADAISSVRLTKGGFPARYGGRLSSVLDIRMKEGNLKEFEGKAAVGLISAKISLEGPIVKDKSSFIVSARRSYLDLFSRPISKIATGGESSFGYQLYDLNIKTNYIFSEKDRFYLSMYVGDDVAAIKFANEDKEGMEKSFGKLGWGNLLAALRWNHIWSPKLFSNLTTTFTRYRFITSLGYSYIPQNSSLHKEELEQQYESGVRDWGIKWDFDFYLSPSHEIKFGANGVRHFFFPGVSTLKQQEAQSKLDTTLSRFNTLSQEYFVYLEDNWKLSQQLSANIGIHASLYSVENDTYYAIQPRVSFRYQFLPKWAFKASYSRMTQYLHLLSSSAAGLPTDLWVPATNDARPQEAEQLAVSFSASLDNSNSLEISIEGYYKQMDDLIAYKEGSTFFTFTENWEEQIESMGKGEAYGVEIFFQKKKGKTNGWVGYTLSWNNRQFDHINQGISFPYRYDRRHDLSIVVIHEVNEKINLSGSWVFGSGSPITISNAKYSTYFPFIENRSQVGNNDFSSVIEFADDGRNSFRMRDYHRLDLGVHLTKQKKWGERTWTFSIYNVYSRRNPFFYFYGNRENPSTGLSEEGLIQFSLFPIIPSFSYQIKF